MKKIFIFVIFILIYARCSYTLKRTSNAILNYEGKKAYILHISYGKVKKAFMMYKNILKKTRIFRRSPYKAYFFIGKSFAIIGDFINAYDFIDRSIAWAYIKKNKKWVNRGFLELANIKIKQANIKKAFRILNNIKTTYKENTAYKIYLLGKIHLFLGNESSSTRYINKSSHILKTLSHKDIFIKELFLTVLLEKCNIFKQKKEYEKALKCYDDIYLLAKKYKNKKISGDSLNGKAIVYFEKNKHKLAMQNFLDARKLYDEIWDYIGESAIYTNIGNIYLKQHNILKAMKLFKSALSLDLIISNKALLAVDYFNLAKIYEKTNNFTKAKTYYEKAIMLDRELGNKKALVIDLYSYSKLLKRLGKTEKALEFLDESLKIAHNIGAIREAIYIKKFIDEIKKRVIKNER